MKKLLILFLACLPLMGTAKEKNDNSDPKYLAGAITMNDGKIEFTKEISTKGLTRTEVYQALLNWAKGRFVSNGKLHSQVAYADEERGEIAAVAEEYMVFSSSALSLDRTRIYYQFLIHVGEETCQMTMTRIRYWYEENRDGGERYTAEEWITDDMALNKKGTKLAPICGKFRRETIDLKDALFESATAALGQKLLNEPAQVPMVALQPATPVQTQPSASGELKAVGVAALPADLASMAKQGRITLTALNGEETELKAENWGGFGKLFGKDVAYLLIDKSRIAASALMEQSETYEVSFYLAGSNEPSVVVNCKKSMSQKMTADELKSLNQNIDTSKEYVMYIGEVTGAQMR